jgi:Ca2+-binding EF-hand superfamily protein|eukprot:g882.t1
MSDEENNERGGGAGRKKVRRQSQVMSFRAKIQVAKKNNAKSNLDENQVEEFKEAFKVFDEDNGGSIDDEEFTNLIGMLGYNFTEDEIANIFNAVDEAGEEEILFDDFLTLMVVLMASDNDAIMMENAFSSLDKSNTGKIPIKHVDKILRSLGEQLTHRELKYFLKLVDPLDNGYVTLADIERMVEHE